MQKKAVSYTRDAGGAGTYELKFAGLIRLCDAAKRQDVELVIVARP